MLTIIKCYKKLYRSNFFPSYSLLCELQQKGFRATGIIRDNRTNKCPLKTPKQVEKMTRGSYDHRFEVNDEVLIVRWKDNKAVGIASNFDTILPEVYVQRWSSESKSRIPIVQPYVIQTYNKYMDEIDHRDWLLENILFRLKKKNDTDLYSRESWTWQWSIVLYYTDLFIDPIYFQ